MKPAKFDYHSPQSRSEALELLAEHGDDAKILAGGQSLMPLMNMRLVRPSVVIDINGIGDLAHITPEQDGGLSVGALTRHRQIEQSSLVWERFPLLAEAVPNIGHFQIRNRGTVGGSLAHADPAAEIPALSLTLDAEFVITKKGSERVVNADEFFVTHLTTILEPDEMLTQVRFPSPPQPWQWGFQEVCRRAGDFALVGAVAMLQLDANGVCQDGRITIFGASGTPLRISAAEGILQGSQVDADVRQQAAEAVSQALDPISDIHASAEYRKDVGGVMARRALEQALAASPVNP
jgi:CO/xanthine dehydrogenase FAD-binding subunit